MEAGRQHRALTRFFVRLPGAARRSLAGDAVVLRSLFPTLSIGPVSLLSLHRNVEDVGNL